VIATNLRGAFLVLAQAAQQVAAGGRDITVNAVAPGPVGTDLFLISVSLLAGPDGGWVNSQVLRANGGFA
jgi:3-oxoacyl-[acyl-carrier protein] reductase